MERNLFLERFKSKTNSELGEILADKNSYTDDARLASIQILKERNGNTTELESATNEINNKRARVIEKEQNQNPLTEDPSAPSLHSKTVITGFSVIFSTIFGAVLLMYNMKQTDNKKGRIQVLIFGILYTIVSIVIINLLNINSGLTYLLNFAGAGILNEYFWNQFIGKDFKYRKRSFIKPAIISIIITIPFILALIYGE